jgi:hypothetical protein
MRASHLTHRYMIELNGVDPQGANAAAVEFERRFGGIPGGIPLDAEQDYDDDDDINPLAGWGL